MGNERGVQPEGKFFTCFSRYPRSDSDLQKDDDFPIRILVGIIEK